ncbi:MAG TPA: threonine ammonia-lyase [Gaiellales bacterium]
MVGLAEIRAARELLAGVAMHTPVLESRTFSDATDSTLLLKAENLQKTGSFKIRGATNRLAHLTAIEREAGVVTSSAGNHAQGVALAARTLGIRATVYMPVDAPLSKQAATRGYGAEVVLEGESFDDAQAAARRDAGPRPFISAFDDEHVVAGQGTVGLEIAEDVPNAKVVVVPLGGGGLLSGIAIALRELNPSCRIVGVQAAGCAPFRASLAAGEPQLAASSRTIADGIAVKRPGAITFPLIRDLVDEIVEVDEDEIVSAMVALIERAKLVVEGAGAAGLAALLSGRIPVAGKTVVCVLSGGNIDAALLQAVVRHGLTSGGRYLVCRTKILDRPGSLGVLLGHLAEDRINIVDVEHHREGIALGVTDVEVELTLETRDPAHCVEVLDTLRRRGYEVERSR